MTDATVRQAQRVLAEAEASICELIKAATEARDYESVPQLSELAEAISSLREELEVAPIRARPAADPSPSRRRAVDAQLPATPSGRLPAVRRKPDGKAAGKRAFQVPSPAFALSGDNLVMTGSGPRSSSKLWTAHKSAVDAATSYLESLENEPSVDDLLCGVRALNGDGASNEEIDVVIAWMMDGGIIGESRGGTLFLTESGADLRPAVDELWDTLAEE